MYPHTFKKQDEEERVKNCVGNSTEKLKEKTGSTLGVTKKKDLMKGFNERI